MPQAVEHPHATSPAEVAEALGVDPSQGLSEDGVRRRREAHGPNRLRETEGRSVVALLLQQFRSIVVLILVAAAILGFAVGHLAEGLAVVAVIVVNTTIGFLSEWKAVRSMEALREQAEPAVRVRRDGESAQVPVETLVPGDVVVLEAGDVVPADLRLTEANRLRLDEAALTGESIPVGKTTEAVDDDAPVGDRRCMLMKGTTVTEGSGEGLVVATGMETELGRISEMAEEAESERTPLEQRLNRLGAKLAWVVLGLAAGVAGAGLAAGQPTLEMIKTSIALAVAAVPEGLPIVATVALARGLWLMARHHALTKRLMSVETLGATTVIFADKTGTLTENRMTLRRALTPAGDVTLEDEGDPPETDPLLERLVEIGVLCNNAELHDDGGDGAEGRYGDPTEVALLRAGRRFGFTREELLRDQPERREEAFDPDVMMMATFHEAQGGLDVAVKGAPRAVLEVCNRVATEDGGEEPLSDDDRDTWTDRAEGLAAEGHRVLAMADRMAEEADEDPYRALRLVGLVGLLDPPREGVADALEACHTAGIRVVMVTGDQPETARSIADEVDLVAGEDEETVPVRRGRGLDELEDPDAAEDLPEERRADLLETSVFARVSPAQKLSLLRVFQDAGETVAMTGDGVNDAPALKRADIGVAMGQRGTEAARQVADMVLQDDAFSTIVAAVEQGRIIFDNIRKAVMFLLCTNVAEILAVTVAGLAVWPLPLKPLQILYLNVLTDALPALALGMGKGDPQVMRRPPRDPDEPILTRDRWLAIGAWSAVIAVCVLAALAAGRWGLGADEPRAVTLSFLTLGFAKLGFVLNLRDRGTRVAANEIVENPWVWASIAVCSGLLVLAVYLPGLAGLLQTRRPGLDGWAVILSLALLPVLLGQTIRFVQGLRRPNETSAG